MTSKLDTRNAGTCALALSAMLMAMAFVPAGSWAQSADAAPDLQVTPDFGVSVSDLGTLKPNGVRHVSVEEARRLIEAYPDFIVLDVRTRREYRKGHIFNALNVNYFALNFRKRIASLDPSKTYIVHCKSGHRSGRAAPILKEEGIEQVIHMDGGFDGWKDAGYPVVTG